MKYDKEKSLLEANSGDTVVLVYQEKQEERREEWRNESLTICIPTQSQDASEAKHFNITLYNPSSKRGRVTLFKLHEIIGEANTKQLVDKLNTLPIYSNNNSYNNLAIIIHLNNVNFISVNLDFTHPK